MPLLFLPGLNIYLKKLFYDSFLQITEEEIREQTINGLVTKSIINREQIVSVYSTLLPYGYPIPSVEVPFTHFTIIF